VETLRPTDPSQTWSEHGDAWQAGELRKEPNGLDSRMPDGATLSREQPFEGRRAKHAGHTRMAEGDGMRL